MWRALILTIAMLSVTADAVDAARPKPRKAEAETFASADHLLKWMAAYRTAPDPERLPAAVRTMTERGLIRDADQAGIYIGFTAGVLGANPDRAEGLIGAMFPMAPEDQVLIVKAIAFSGLENWQAVLAGVVERMPARKVLIEKYLYGDGKTLADLALDSSPFAIDANWGYYFATGDMAPVGRIVKAVAWSKERDNVEKLTIGNMAKWTLAQNATRDSDLMNFLKRDLSEEPEPVRGPLREVIDAAETFELGKIRKEALATVEELRAKGPESTRRFAWWGQAGQTALALGCVVGGALGQAEIGLPCVIGGALSTAALKYFSPSTP